MIAQQKQTTIAKSEAHILDLGMVDYLSALDLQTNLRDCRIAGEIPDTLVLLEHPPVITLGRSGNMENVLVSESELSNRGIQLFHTNRGGDVTYHGPGQIVGYPIMDLTQHGTDLRKHVGKLEEVLIQTLDTLAVKSNRREKETGIWVGDNKIASIGIHVKRWVTMHGFALNVAPDMEHLSLIHHCGIKDAPMTSVEEILGRPVPRADVLRALTKAFERVFGLRLEGSLEEIH